MKVKSFENSHVDDFIFRFCEYTPTLAKEYVDSCFKERVTSEFTHEMTSYLALARYFRLLERGRESMRGILTAEEFERILTCKDSQDFKNQSDTEDADLEQDAYRKYISDRYFCPEFDAICQKINDLELIQQVIFGDVLECASHSNDPVAYAMSALG